MNGAVDKAEASWALCAAVVDTIVDCQAKDAAREKGAARD